MAGSANALQFTNTLTNGSLTTVIQALSPIVAPQKGQVVPTVSRNGSNLLTAVGFPKSVFAVTHLTIPVTDPGAYPIAGVVATVKNSTAALVRGGNNKLGGQMPLIGVNKVCLFGPCSSALQNLTVPVNVVGAGGAVNVTAAVNVTVVGAPWTQGTAAIGTITQMGNAGAATQTTMGGTYVNTVQLVTPIFISTGISVSAVVPAFGFLDFTVTSKTPEPGTLAAFGAAIVGLLGVGVSRRRPS